MSVHSLFRDLKKLEAESRFDGRPYPEGLHPFPRTLVGQGFFPGGDGLWRDAEPEALRQASRHVFPVGGIMFLGNDFGSLAGFQRLGLYENPPTWRWLRNRLAHAGIPGRLGFYTNAYLGLRTDRSALANPVEHCRYTSMCAEYLALQIRTQSPRLIVALGPRPTRMLGRLAGLSDFTPGHQQLAHIEHQPMIVLSTSHPYSDFAKQPNQRAAEGESLRTAWAWASNLVARNSSR